MVGGCSFWYPFEHVQGVSGDLPPSNWGKCRSMALREMGNTRAVCDDTIHGKATRAVAQITPCDRIAQRDERASVEEEDARSTHEERVASSTLVLGRSLHYMYGT